MFEASKVLQRPLNSAKFCKDLLISTGFVGVVETQYKWPMNRWPKDPKYKELGMWAHENISAGLQGLSLALFTRGLGWSVDELEVLLADVRKDMKNPRIHSYWPM
ncbi:putative methyltransferase tdiE [Hyphodiscus hymeniophilus]|uniref:Methyltransferase tdiE n=1 Tax=Hyphodiscus hymeniophilus TaxID=353542 RepID=A0A9P6VEG0_9HELO|nr:putative methyltransferase tdiE [Hyphodiscus hymeniophilus]